MRRAMLIVAALALALPAVTGAQQKPNYAGTWKFISIDPKENAKGIFGGWAAAEMQLQITQSGNTVVVVRDGKKINYTIGSMEWQDTADPLNKDPGGPYPFKTRARWDGDKLVLFTRQALNQTRDIMTLTGTQLSILRDVESPPGSQTSTLVFSKS